MSFFSRATLTLFLISLLGSLSLHAEEKLRVLAWPGYADDDWVSTFETLYKAKVEVTFIETDDELWQRLNHEKIEQFDVFAANTAQMQRYIANGISIPLDLSTIPNQKNQLPRFRDLQSIPGIHANYQVFAIPFTYSEMGLIYDPKQFDTPPTSFSSMWDPAYRGKVLMYKGSEHNFSVAAMALGLKSPFQIPEKAFPEVARYLVSLRRNVLTFYEKPDEATRLFTQNNIALLFANYGRQQVTLLKKAGANIAYTIPQEGVLAWLDCWSVTKYAPNKRLAQQWINFMLSANISRQLTQRQGLPNTLENLPSDNSVPAITEKDKILWLERVENNSKRAQLWEQILSGESLSQVGE